MSGHSAAKLVKNKRGRYQAGVLVKLIPKWLCNLFRKEFWVQEEPLPCNLPHSHIIQRDGHTYVFRFNGEHGEYEAYVKWLDMVDPL